MRSGRFLAAPLGIQEAEANERPALAAPVSDLACPRKRRLELNACIRILPRGRQRPAHNPIHAGGRGCAETGSRLHHGRELDPDPERSAQTQSRPGALQRVCGHLGIASRNGPATRRDEIVELRAGVGDCRLLVQAREVRAVTRLRRKQRRRPAPGIACWGTQVLGRILLHAYQEIKAIVCHLPDKRLLHQRLQRVHGPGRVVIRGQVEDCLYRLQRESALEHRQLGQRGFLGQRQQVPRPIEYRTQRRLTIQTAARG